LILKMRPKGASEGPWPPQSIAKLADHEES